MIPITVIPIILAIAVSLASLVGAPNAYALAGICGDGVLETGQGEQCDDGNFSSGDGCSNMCEVESGWECTSVPFQTSVCTLIPLNVGGQIIPVDSTALLVAGAQTNALWLISLIGTAVVLGVVLAKKKFH